MPLAVAASTSTVSTPTPYRPMARRLGAPSITSAVICAYCTRIPSASWMLPTKVSGVDCSMRSSRSRSAATALSGSKASWSHSVMTTVRFVMWRFLSRESCGACAGIGNVPICRGTSAHLRHREGVHVVEGLVLPGHRPDEGVGGCSHSGVHGPARGDHGLLIGDGHVPGLVGTTEEVDDARLLGEVEVEVALGTTIMRVRGHGVPHRAGMESGHAHDDLAGLHAALMDVLVQRAAVRGQRIAELANVPLPRGDERGRMRGMGGRGEDIEARVGRHPGGERHRGGAAPDVQAGPVGEL